jgi:hypothetical protein
VYWRYVRVWLDLTDWSRASSDHLEYEASALEIIFASAIDPLQNERQCPRLDDGNGLERVQWNAVLVARHS